MQHLMIPHIQESTLPVALARISENMPDLPNSTIHDFRRTVRSHLSTVGVQTVIAERCLNHKRKGVEGIYNRYQYLGERKKALGLWCEILICLDKGIDYNVTPLRA